MSNDNNNKLQTFEGQKVRTVWSADEQQWYFSIVDVISILTDQSDSKKASTYWSVLKGRLRKEGADEPLTNCKKLKMLSADGKLHPTDAANQSVLFRIIQSIPSKKAEPFKQWMAQVASDRIDQMQDPELSEGYRQNAQVAQEGAEVARDARTDIETRLGHSIISPERAIDHTNPEGTLPLNDEEPFTE